MQDTVKVDLKQDERYSVIKVIQEHSFETISLVKDTSQYHKHYLKRDFKGQDLEKFQNKLDSYSQLEHPQIEQIEQIEHSDVDSKQQQLSIIQTYVEGKSLLESKTFLSEYEAVQLMNQVLKVLSYLHNQGFIHGDISPSNLIETEDKLLILVNFKLIQDIRETAKKGASKDSKQTKPSSNANLEQKNESTTEVEFNSFPDIRDLAITVLMLMTGLKREELLRKNGNTWEWSVRKQISDSRAAVFKKMLDADLFKEMLDANSIHVNDAAKIIHQLLNTVKPTSASDSLSYLTTGVFSALGILVIFVGLVAIFLSADNSSNTPSIQPEPSRLSETQEKFSCPQGELIAIACDVELKDSDSPDFDGGELTVKIVKGGTENDRLLIYQKRPTTASAEENNNQVTYRNLPIGSFSGGIGTKPLKVVFNSSATVKAVETTVKSIIYQNVSDNPKKGTRTLEIRVTDGDGESSNTLNRIVTITPVNQRPVITVPGMQTAKEDQKLSIQGISVKEPDGNNICLKFSADKGQIIVNDNVAGGVSFRGIKYNSDNTVAFCGTPSQVNKTLKANNGIVYESNTNFIGSDRLTIFAQDLSDNDTISEQEFIWPVGALKSKTDRKDFEITVEPTNDAPRLIGFSNADSSILTSESAVKVIRDWLEIKGQILGRSPNRQLLSEYTTGVYYNNYIKRDGTINWLIRNRAYYTYEKPSVELVGNFRLSGKQAKIDVRTYERPTLYVDGSIDWSASGDQQGVYRFTLEFSNGKWKIAKSQELD
ncbi:MAG: DUF4101 domain-containing protein [Okeania sp. SIO3I5]|uniref:IMS domain-containing protein n=1 Tax=Okeania sp. SIO3I5 TaxID=2607805 RepID=UPI0013BA9F55|nr:IMS domain-containing protein [Okeania sp. SIO3I5]NEQ37952.1 DUF4101 domain-containing protein [Okeania sp. SIO3I5]